MAKLSIRTGNFPIESVVLVGQFCDWDIERAERIHRKHGGKYIVKEDMPKGEYRILNCESYLGGEVYPTDGRQMANRYFSGDVDEIISVYFDKEV